MAPYFSAAALTNDPIERMKLVMTATIACIVPNHTWSKPLNPILGETHEAMLNDGSHVYVEQISHHPPISFILVDGPDNLYQFSGYSCFSVKAFINSVNLEVSGFKQIKFKDGSIIKFNNQ